MSLTLLTAPTCEPVTLADLKLQLGLSPVEDTDPVKADMLSRQLRRLIATARAECEEITNTAFITQTWRWKLDGWPKLDREYARNGCMPLVLPKPPFQSIVAFSCIGSDGTTRDLSGLQFHEDAGGNTQPCRLSLPSGSWPGLRPGPGSITMDFTCGYGDTPTSVPPTIQQAILFLAQFYYENGAVTDLPVPRVVANLLNRETNWNS